MRKLLIIISIFILSSCGQDDTKNLKPIHELEDMITRIHQRYESLNPEELRLVYKESQEFYNSSISTDTVYYREMMEACSYYFEEQGIIDSLLQQSMIQLQNLREDYANELIQTTEVYSYVEDERVAIENLKMRVDYLANKVNARLLTYKQLTQE